MAQANPIETLVVDNFLGQMTVYPDGPINSGKTNILQSFGYNSFKLPGNLSWSAAAVQIDSAGSVITDLIMAGKERVESGIVYVYAIGHTGRLYKIQVNDPTTFNPDYDNPVLLATLSAQSPTFTRGGFIDFYGATERIYIGHDKGVTRIDFDGTNEAFIGALGSWTQNVPRVLKQFVGKLYVGNGDNIAEIDTTATVTDYTKLDPAFPKGTQVRDMDVSIDGNYLNMVVSRLAQADMTVATQDTSIISNMESYIFKWNGTDVGYTAFDTFPLTNLTSNIVMSEGQYVFGYDLRGATFFDPVRRIAAGGDSASFEQTPFPNAVMSDGNMVGFATTLFFDNHLELSYCVFGYYDWETPMGYWSPFGMLATGTETDIIRVPYWQPVSNFNIGSSSNGYSNLIFGTSKIYFSTLETSSAPTTKYKFYKWSVVPTPDATIGDYNTYQTQTQLFSKKVTIKQVRIYGEPWVASNEFTVELIGSDEGVIPGSSKTFTAGSNLTVGDDFAWYTPDCPPTYAIALRIFNTGTTNNIITKVEIDYSGGGQ